MAVDLISERVPVEAIAADATDVDRTGDFPARAMRSLREAGLLGIAVPEAFGGRGASLAEIADVVEKVAGACCSTGMVYAMHVCATATIAAGAGSDRAGAARRRAARDRGGDAPHDARILGAWDAEPLLGAVVSRCRGRLRCSHRHRQDVGDRSPARRLVRRRDRRGRRHVAARDRALPGRGRRGRHRDRRALRRPRPARQRLVGDPVHGRPRVGRSSHRRRDAAACR